MSLFERWLEIERATGRSMTDILSDISYGRKGCDTDALFGCCLAWAGLLAGNWGCYASSKPANGFMGSHVIGQTPHQESLAWANSSSALLVVLAEAYAGSSCPSTAAKPVFGIVEKEMAHAKSQKYAEPICVL